jgi:hypothetical protein
MAVSLISTGLSGNILNSGMPAFCVDLATTNNVTGDNTTWPASTTAAAALSVITERFDQGGDLTGGLFTAPVTGRYFLAYTMGISGMTSSNNYGNSQLFTSNQNYVFAHSYDWYRWFYPGATWIGHISGAVFTDMDLGDTAYANIAIYGVGKTVDINTFRFMGYLVC